MLSKIPKPQNPKTPRHYILKQLLFVNINYKIKYKKDDGIKQSSKAEFGGLAECEKQTLRQEGTSGIRIKFR